MKKVLTALMAVAIALVFVSVAAAQKSVVSIVKCTSKSDLKLLSEDFHINDDVAHEQTTAFHEKTGEYVRAVWSEASEKVWYKYVKDAVDKIGGLPIKAGDTILIKPNFVLSFYPMQWMGFGDDNSIQGAFADPRAALAVAQMAAEKKAGRIIIAECPALGDFWATARNYGLEWVQERYAKNGIKYELMDLCDDWEMMPGLGLASKEYPIPKILKQVDCLVPISAFKTHEYGGVTLALKNVGIGIPSARVIGMCKFGLPHQNLAEVNTDVNYITQKLVPNEIHIVDAVYAGTWVPAAPYFASGMIMASKDPVALDAIGTAVMNHNPRNIGTTRMCAEHGLGKMEYDEIQVVGTSLEEAIIQDFPRHPYKARKWPWTPTMYGKVSNWDAFYRHELYGVPNYPRW
ncbi:MAG: DUF362 domain-containing protein [Thermodesulfobacteriota bacterium]